MKQVWLTQRAANAVCQTLVVTTFAVSRVATGWSIEDAPSQGAWPHSEKGRTPFSEAWKSALGPPDLRRPRKMSVAIVETRHSQSDQVATTTD